MKSVDSAMMRNEMLQVSLFLQIDRWISARVSLGVIRLQGFRQDSQWVRRRLEMMVTSVFLPLGLVR